MDSLSITLAAAVAVVLIHFSYVDFRFRYMDGFRWYWLMTPAPFAMWLSRGAIVLAFVAALSIRFIGISEELAIVIVGLVLVHIAALIVLELMMRR